MNIESVKVATPPPRATLPDATVAARPSAEKGRFAEAAKTPETAKNQQLAEDKNQKVPSSLSVEDAVKRLSNFVAPTQSQISFSIDQESGVSVVKILDNESKEVIRQFPSEEAIALAHALDKLQGLLIKDKA
ncbi:MAG: flagellar protein FlaG [Azonexus sp.]|nr:flagellar protein FlaG [Azonexus sp.]